MFDHNKKCRNFFYKGMEILSHDTKELLFKWKFNFSLLQNQHKFLLLFFLKQYILYFCVLPLLMES